MAVRRLCIPVMVCAAVLLFAVQPVISQELNIKIPETVFVEAGTFTMGMDVYKDNNTDSAAEAEVDAYTGATPFKECPAHQVTMPSYWIGKYEVTNEEFAEFVDDGGYDEQKYWIIASRYHEEPNIGWIWKEETKREAPGHTAFSWDLGSDPYWDGDPYSNQATTPVIGVTWYEAYAYCNWLSEVTGDTYRLPTEAEWEYAARGPESNIFPWGNEYLSAEQMCGEPGSGAMANCWVRPDQKERCSGQPISISMELGDGQTYPVGSYPEGVSYFGAYDMAGNISELTADWFRGYYYPLRIATGQTEDPQGPRVPTPPFYVPIFPFWTQPARAQRSLSFKQEPIGDQNYSSHPTYPLRCSHRQFGFRFMGSSMVGFRVMKEAE